MGSFAQRSFKDRLQRSKDIRKSECQQLICQILRATPEAASADAAVETARLAIKSPSKEKSDKSEDGLSFAFRFTDASVPSQESEFLMAPSKITLFKDLSVLTQEYTLKVRIIRLWTRPMLNDATKVYSYEMIIMDETGAKMEATVLKKYCTSYQMLLQEKQCLLIYKPTMAENHYKYKVYPIPHKICFLEKTVVTSSPEPVASEYGFYFTDFKLLKDKKLAENTTIDIIGAVIKYYSMVKLEQPDGKLSKRLNLQLKDLEDKEVDVTLWDQFAEQFETFVNQNEHDRNLVIIIQFGKYRTFKGCPQVSNAYTVTKLFIDSDIEEISTFKQRFIEKSKDQMSSSESGFTTSIITSTMKDDFLKDNDFSTIGEIHDTKTPKFLIIVGTVKGVIDDVPWYYSGCKKCSSKVTTNVTCTLKPDGSGEFDECKVIGCKICKDDVITAVPKFKIPIRVQDCTGTVTLTLFDREARKVLQISASHLLDNNEELSTLGNVPTEFNSIVDKKFAFKIHVAKYNLETNKEYYSISKLTTDLEILSNLERKLEPLQESVSWTGDEVTPVSNIVKSKQFSSIDDEETPSSMFAGQDLKRNLHFVYDVEEGSSHSSTKQRISYKKDDDKGPEKQTLLTPKIEK